MELRKLDVLAAAEKGVTFNVVDAYGVETDLAISVVGAGSRVFKLEKAKNDQVIAQATQRRKPLSDDEESELWCSLLSKCTTGWENLELDGKALPFSQENAMRVYTDFPFIRSQVLEKIYDIKGLLENL